jgi:hypothetical protein
VLVAKLHNSSLILAIDCFTVKTWKDVVALSFSHLPCHLVQEIFPTV